MAFSADIRIDEDVLIIDMSGFLIIGVATLKFQTTLTTAVARGEGRVKIILNMQEVNYIDSAGLGEIFRVYSELQPVNGRVVIFGASNRFESLASVTSLNKFIDFFKTEADALAAMK